MQGLQHEIYKISLVVRNYAHLQQKLIMADNSLNLSPDDFPKDAYRVR